MTALRIPFGVVAIALSALSACTHADPGGTTMAPADGEAAVVDRALAPVAEAFAELGLDLESGLLVGRPSGDDDDQAFYEFNFADGDKGVIARPFIVEDAALSASISLEAVCDASKGRAPECVDKEIRLMQACDPDRYYGFGFGFAHQCGNVWRYYSWSNPTVPFATVVQR